MKDFLSAAKRTTARNLPWLIIITVLVIVMPVVSFIRNKTLERPSGDSGRRALNYEQPFSTGTVYETERLLSLGVGDGSREIALMALAPRLEVPSFEMAAPSPDGQLVWIADHPASANGRSRVRAFDQEGRLVSNFTVPGGTTLYTPGYSGDLWVDRSAGASVTPGETLLHYSGDGELLGTYPLPARLFARSILPIPTGEVYGLSEEWLIDPDTREATLDAHVIPIVGAEGDAVQDAGEKAVTGSFLDQQGRVWEVETRGGDGGITPSVYTAKLVNPTAESSRSITFSVGARPYAVDAAGRVYAEGKSPKPMQEAPGVSSIGDAAGESVYVEIASPDGQMSRLLAERQGELSGWAPAAWPTADGRLITTRWRDGRLDILMSRPTSVSAPTADARPGRAQARILVGDEAPLSGDPYAALDARERDLFRLIYSGLVSHDASGEPVPDLAVTVPAVGSGVSSDGRTITWEITPGRTWHDGSPVTARDVAATYDYLKRPSIVSRALPFPGFDLIESVRADGDTVVVRLSEPFGAAPEAFFPFVLPAHIVQDQGARAGAWLGTKPIGSGPYRLARWEVRGRWLLKGHADAQVKPNIDRLDVHFVDTEKVRDDYMGSGVPTVWSWVGEEDTEAIERDAVGELVSAETGRWLGLVVNTKAPLLEDARARRALLATYPLQSALGYYGVPDTATISPFWRSGRLELPKDIARGAAAVDDAKRLLRSAGWKDTDGDGVIDADGVAAEAVYDQTFRGGIHEILAEVGDDLMPIWRGLGVKSSWAYGQTGFYGSVAHDGYLSRSQHTIGAGVFPGYPDAGWGSVFDPADTPGWYNLRGTNITFTDDAKLRRLHREARASYDATERAGIGNEILDRVRELDLALIERPEVRKSAVLGLKGYTPGPYPAGEFWNAKDWSVVSP